MKIYTHIIGNIHSPEWEVSTNGFTVEHIWLDQWTAQKSRFVKESDMGTECAVALKRHTQLLDGDILEYQPEYNRVVIIRISLNKVLVADLESFVNETPENIIRMSVEIGHAIGNQHWPAVVKGTKVYIPLTVDTKVMESVMRTHRFEGVEYYFRDGAEIIPYLAPHEIRRLFGGGDASDITKHKHECEWEK